MGLSIVQEEADLELEFAELNREVGLVGQLSSVERFHALEMDAI